MTPEWFYLNDISWYMSTDGRIVAPVAGVVTHLEAPSRNLRFMSVAIAKQCIIDVAPFGKCYEKQALEELWDRLHGHAVERTASMMADVPKNSVGDEKSSENGAEFVNCQKFSEDSDDAAVGEGENG